MCNRLDATHDDGLEVQELDTHALVDLERDARRIGTVRHQARGGMKRGSVGILILKTTGVGDQAAQQAGGDAVACGNATIGQKAVDDHGAGSGIDTPKADLGKLLARRVMVKARHVSRTTQHLGGIIETLDDRHVHRNEQVRVAGVGRCRHQ